MNYKWKEIASCIYTVYCILYIQHDHLISVVSSTLIVLTNRENVRCTLL